jgi:hypothetical protein
MNVTRIMIRAIGENEWHWLSAARLMVMMRRMLKARLAAGKFDLSDLPEPQVVTRIDLFHASPPVPKNGDKAMRQGFLREENPYQPGTAAYGRWDRAYVRAERDIEMS